MVVVAEALIFKSLQFCEAERVSDFQSLTIQNHQGQEISMAKWTCQGDVGAALYPVNPVWLIEEGGENKSNKTKEELKEKISLRCTTS